VVQELIDRGAAAETVAVVRDPTKVADYAGNSIEVRVANYDDPASLEAAFAGLDKVLLISSSELGKRFAQHSNVVDAAKAAGVKQVVYTSAPKATTSALVLAPEHKATEEYLASSGLAYTVLRNNWYTENYAQSVAAAAQTGALVAATGAGRVASATRADYAAGAAAVLTGQGHENKVYELSGDQAWDFNELAAAVAQATGKPCVYAPISVDELAAAMVQGGMDEGLARFFAAVDGNVADGALGEATPELANLIGRQTTPLAETVRKLVG
jgi:NAD(P)H dehydrogenase (quinone)